MKTKEQQIELLCKNIYEMAKQAPYDFCGEQRDFYLLKLSECLSAVGVLFPRQLCDALELVSE